MKEIKELLRDPKILLGVILMPLLMFPLLGVAINLSQASVEQSVRMVTMGFIDLDRGIEATKLRTVLESTPTIRVVILDSPTVEEAIRRTLNISTILVVPLGFTENVTAGKIGTLRSYSLLQSVSLTEIRRTGMADAAANAYERTKILETIEEALPSRDPLTVLNPVELSHMTVVRGAIVPGSPEDLAGIVISQSAMLPVMIMVMLLSAMQIAATSIAIEKEEKTLEVLLTLPVGRLSILTGKLVGSVVVGLASAISYIVGLMYYTNSILSGMPGVGLQFDLESAGLAPTPAGYALLGLAIFVTVISALALSISIAVFSDNVRGAQSLVGFLVIPIVIPSIVLMFADLEMLPFPLNAILFVIPYTHSIIAVREAFTGNLILLLRSVLYISSFTGVVLFMAARIFSTEKVVTARLSFDSLRFWKRRLLAT